jgi:hypothetical protein
MGMTNLLPLEVRPFFEQIVECAYHICLGDIDDYWTSRWNCLRGGRKFPDVAIPITKEEVRTEVLLLFMEMKSKYKVDKNTTSIKSLDKYIYVYAALAIRHLIRKLEKQSIFYPEFVSIDMYDNLSAKRIESGAEFLFNRGSLSHLAEHFTHLERYVIYLHFIRKLRIVKVAKLLVRRTEAINEMVEDIKIRLRRLYNDNTNKHKHR